MSIKSSKYTQFVLLSDFEFLTHTKKGFSEIKSLDEILCLKMFISDLKIATKILRLIETYKSSKLETLT
jgi:hypothetical protein